MNRSGQSTPAIDCKVNQEKRGHLLAAVHHARQPRRQGARRARTKSYIRSCIALNNGRSCAHVSTANVARDMDRLRALLGEQQAQLLRLLVRHLPRRDVRQPLPEPLPGDGARRAGGCRRSTSTSPMAGPRRADGRLRARRWAASSRPARATRWRARASAATTRGRPATSWSSRPTRRRSRRPASRAIRGRSTATTSLDRHVGRRLPQGATGAMLGLGARDAAAGDGSLIRELVDARYAQQPRRHLRSGYDRYFTIGAIEQRYPRDVGLRTSTAATTRGGRSTHLWFNTGYVELNYGLWPERDKDAYGGPFKVPDSQPTPLVVATTYDPATPYRGAKRLVPRPGQRPPADHARRRAHGLRRQLAVHRRLRRELRERPSGSRPRAPRARRTCRSSRPAAAATAKGTANAAMRQLIRCTRARR